MISIMIPAAIKNMNDISIRYAKSCSHFVNAHQATGEAMIKEITTSMINSFDNKLTMPVTDAPTTLRTPMSFVLLSAMNAAKANDPGQERKIARPEKSHRSIAAL